MKICLKPLKPLSQLASSSHCSAVSPGRAPRCSYRPHGHLHSNSRQLPDLLFSVSEGRQQQTLQAEPHDTRDWTDVRLQRLLNAKTKFPALPASSPEPTIMRDVTDAAPAAPLLRYHSSASSARYTTPPGKGDTHLRKPKLLLFSWK
ncbi:hypothetical protein PAMA_010381 [Pampus argenteus]